MARTWFESRGVVLKTESDGRMFPVTNDSQTIIDTIEKAALEAGVVVERRSRVDSVDCYKDSHEDDAQRKRFLVRCKNEIEYPFDALILATGSSKTGHDIAKSMGHNIISPVPSLFTLNMKHEIKNEDGILHGLAGLSVKTARVTFQMPPLKKQSTQAPSPPGGKKRKQNKKPSNVSQEGPLLITHRGLSGPASLKLSAFAAREFHTVNYRGTITVHFCPTLGSANDIETLLWKETFSNKKFVVSGCPFLILNTNGNNNERMIPKRLWSRLCTKCDISPSLPWNQLSKTKARVLSQMIAECTMELTGKDSFKEEFVTAGGLDLKEVNMNNMESKVTPGLYCCGEVVNVDGITGGFNFMNCWGTGYVSGRSAAEAVVNSMLDERG